jgi:hypothetical protein
MNVAKAATVSDGKSIAHFVGSYTWRSYGMVGCSRMNSMKALSAEVTRR